MRSGYRFVNLYDDGSTGSIHPSQRAADDAYRVELTFYNFTRRRVARILVRFK